MSCCGQENRITIVKGNDTNFNGQEFVRLNLTSEVWDLSTMQATIELGGIKKTYTDLSNGIDLSYSAAETGTMPIGDIDGVLKVYDGDSQVATIESLLPFRVVNIVHGNAIAVTPAEFNIEVKQGGETVLNVNVEAGVSVEVGSTTTLSAGSSATVTNSGTENHLVLDFGIPQGEDGEKGEDGKDAKINGVNTLTLTTGDGLSLEQDGNTATIDLDSSVLLNYSDDDESIAIGGESSTSGGYAAAIGFGARAGMAGLAVGHYAQATDEAIQIGSGINNDSGTVQVLSYKLLDSSGIIPDARISSNIARTSALSSLVPNTRTINNKALSSNISLDATDVGALPDSTVIPTVNNATLTIQKNGTNVATFTANSSTNETANITVPTQASDIGAQPAGSYVTTDTVQTITKKKTFQKSIKFVDSEYDSSATTEIKQIGDEFLLWNSNGGSDIGWTIYNNGNSSHATITCDVLYIQSTTAESPTPTQDTTTSVQIDTVGARNTKLANYELKSKPLNTLATSGTISPDTNTRNVVAPTGAITLSLPATPDTTIVNDIELQVNQTSTVGFNFGSVLWGEDGAPDMSVGIWDFIFSYIAGHWVGSYKKWETS